MAYGIELGERVPVTLTHSNRRRDDIPTFRRNLLLTAIGTLKKFVLIEKDAEVKEIILKVIAYLSTLSVALFFLEPSFNVDVGDLHQRTGI